jgi:dipeptidyl aminopeptidase/acylaminoacyl peptidase
VSITSSTANHTGCRLSSSFGASGGYDGVVSIEQSKLMQARLSAARARSELVTFEDLGHPLEDSDARAKMLRRSDAFLREAFGM